MWSCFRCNEILLARDELLLIFDEFFFALAAVCINILLETLLIITHLHGEQKWI
jgi:hypothetical protein